MQLSHAGAPAATSTLACLRAATSQAHAATEALVGFHGTFSRAHYARVLQAFDAFLSRWEPLILQALPPALADWLRPRLRGARVRQDLDALGLARAPRAELPLALPSVAAALGSLYVLEGSALGAQVIAPRLARELGIDAASGGAYFAGNGEATGAMWREFRELLEREVGDCAKARTEACDAAVATFDALRHTLADRLP
jgi:heme oxygenase